MNLAETIKGELNWECDFDNDSKMICWWLDAALEYHILEHEAKWLEMSKLKKSVQGDLWSDIHGWQCDCFRDAQ